MRNEDGYDLLQFNLRKALPASGLCYRLGNTPLEALTHYYGKCTISSVICTKRM